MKDYLKLVLLEILEGIRRLSGCQSVGIRLRLKDDYPYYVYEGFPGFFIQKENFLCARDEEDKEVLDAEGNPLLECMCGNVIKGHFDPKFSFFSNKGSFWTNSTTQLLSTFTREQRNFVGQTRDMCHNSGYESVALIPIQAEGKILGLIQFNDPRENMFTPERIGTYELLAGHVGAIMSNALKISETMSHIKDLTASVHSSEKSNFR